MRKKKEINKTHTRSRLQFPSESMSGQKHTQPPDVRDAQVHMFFKSDEVFCATLLQLIYTTLVCTPAIKHQPLLYI